MYPKSATDSLLEVRIRAFAVNNATPEEISAAIGNLPEVREWLSKHHVQRRELETGARWGKSDGRTSLKVDNLPLRSLLNRVVLETGRANWIVVRYGNKAEHVAIYI